MPTLAGERLPLALVEITPNFSLLSRKNDRFFFFAQTRKSKYGKTQGLLKIIKLDGFDGHTRACFGKHTTLFSLPHHDSLSLQPCALIALAQLFWQPRPWSPPLEAPAAEDDAPPLPPRPPPLDAPADVDNAPPPLPPPPPPAADDDAAALPPPPRGCHPKRPSLVWKSTPSRTRHPPPGPPTQGVWRDPQPNDWKLRVGPEEEDATDAAADPAAAAAEAAAAPLPEAAADAAAEAWPAALEAALAAADAPPADAAAAAADAAPPADAAALAEAAPPEAAAAEAAAAPLAAAAVAAAVSTLDGLPAKFAQCCDADAAALAAALSPAAAAAAAAEAVDAAAAAAEAPCVGGGERREKGCENGKKDGWRPKWW